MEARSVAGVVITIDHFGNLITNIDGSARSSASGCPWCTPATTRSRCCAPTATPAPGSTWRW